MRSKSFKIRKGTKVRTGVNKSYENILCILLNNSKGLKLTKTIQITIEGEDI